MRFDNLAKEAVTFLSAIRQANTKEAFSSFALHLANEISHSYSKLDTSSNFRDDLSEEVARVQSDLNSGLLTDRAKAIAEVQLVWLRACSERDRNVFAQVNNVIHWFIEQALPPSLLGRAWIIPPQKSTSDA